MPSQVMDNGLPTGIGDNVDATQVTAFIRQQPWYLDWLAQNKIVPGPDQQIHPTKQQRQQLAQLATDHGIGLNNKFDQFDENGQVSEAHHKLKKTLIAAAIGGAALTGFGAAGIGPLAGAFAGGTAAGAGGAAAIPTTMGIESATALGLPVTAGLGSAGAAAAGGSAAALAPLAAHSTVPATGALVPAGTSSLAGGSTAAATGGSTLSRAEALLRNHGGDIASAVGSGVGDAATAAGNNRLTRGQLALANQQANTNATSAFETEMLNRAKEEQSQRNDALKQQSYASYTQNRKPGPFNTAGLTPYSPEVQATNKALAEQATKKLANAPQYDTNGMPVLKPNTLDPDEFMKQYGQEGTLEKTANWLTPTLSTLSRVARYF